MPDSAEASIRVGSLFQSLELPRRLWRVTGLYGDNVRLERIDQPNIIRYPVRKVLLDRHRYLPAA